MKKHPYQPFETFVLRTPLFPFGRYVRDDYGTAVFDEAVYLASPEFYAEYLKSENRDPKIRVSAYKYHARACTRSTPFGLFAGCSTGRIGTETRVVLEDLSRYGRCTRLDMNYLCALIQQLEQKPDIRRQLLFYPNDSLYAFGRKFRYVEYYYRKTSRVHRISAVDRSDYLERVLEAAAPGKRVEELAALLVDGEITREDAEDFVLELIDNQLLKSELEAGVTGPDQFDALIAKLARLEGVETELEGLRGMREGLREIDSHPPGTTLPVYGRVTELVRRTEVPFEPKFLFQTDMIKPVRTATVSEGLLDDIRDTLDFLNRLTPRPAETPLDQFKKAFQQRYEEAEMPLLQVLDTELGIGYLQNGGGSDINPFVDDLMFPRPMPRHASFTLDPTQTVLLRKYTENLKAGRGEEPIRLTDGDFPDARPDWSDTHLTLSVMCQVLKDRDGERRFYLSSAGGSCAANLLGRFCHLSDDLYRHARRITDYEQEQDPETVYAEIVHLPESRIGNIVGRPLLRDYEIRYLCKPGVDERHCIPLSDLTVSVRRDRVVLRSRRLGREVMPRLTTAHNYSGNGLPVYHFLCDMQNQGRRVGFYLNTAGLVDICRHFPRVEYRNAVLFRAAWSVEAEELKEAEKLGNEVLSGRLEQWRREREVPRFITIPVGDNELFIDLEDDPGRRTFLSVLKKNKRMTVNEFLFDPQEAVITDGEEGFCGEFLFSFFKSENR